MFDWAATAAAEAAEQPLGWQELLTRLALALLFGVLVAGVYALAQRRSLAASLPLLTTLLLLTMLVAMTTIVIGNNTARAFGLVGALSIVRFRTVVDDTRDTSFVIFAVVVGMALGAGNLLICLIGVPLVGAAAIALGMFNHSSGGSPERRLEVRIGAGRDPEQMLQGLFAEHLAQWRLATVISARQGAALDVMYRVRLRDAGGIFPLVKAIHSLDGVQTVELKEE